MSVLPKAIRRLISSEGVGRGVGIRWGDSPEVELSSAELRNACPCASCNEERGDSSHQTPLTPNPPASGLGRLRVVQSTENEQLNLVQIWPVGRYALGMLWGDKHSTGIYTFTHLWELSSSKMKTMNKTGDD